MNKTININLAGIFFHIDEDAYTKLSRYLNAIKQSLKNSEGREEIIADIEARVAELFTERIQNNTHVVSVNLVDDVIAIMGQPEDYIVDETIFDDTPENEFYNKKSKSNLSKKIRRLYRDADTSYVGGVAAGLGHYFGIDALWIRLIWVLLIFGAGTGVLLYILLWALIPEATTTAEKLTMTGEPVNISNIEKKIKDGFDTVSEKVKNVDFQKHGEKIKESFDSVSDNISETFKSTDFKKKGHSLKSGSQQFFEGIGNLVLFVFKVVAKFIGVLLIFVSITTLLALIVAFFTVGVSNAVHMPPFNFIEAANAANIPIWVMSLLLFFAVGIPFFFLFYLGLKILVNNLKSIGGIAKFSLLGIWIIAIIGIIITGIKQASEHAFDAKTVVKTNLAITANDTLTIVMKSKDNAFYNYKNNRRNYEPVIEDEEGKHIITNKVRLIVKSTKNNTAFIQLEKEASGSNYKIARQRAEAINYSFNLNSKTLQLDDFLSTDFQNKFSNQNVVVYLYIPENAVLVANQNTHAYHQNKSYVNDILKSGMEEKYLKILNNDVLCLNCKDELDTRNEEHNNTSSIQSKIMDKAAISIKINDNDGVKIKLNDN